LHVQDFEVDAAFDLGIIRSARVRRWVSALESWLMRRFDAVSTISPNMLRRLETKGVEPGRRLLFPNWADTDAVFPLAGPSPLRERLGIPADAVVALYSGNIGLKQGLESVVEAARLLEGEPRLQFVIGGQGAGYAALRERAAGLPNIRWIPLQPLEELNNLLNCADIHLLPQRADAADLVMPSKLTGMLASGRPVVAGAHPDTQLWEAIQGCGIAVRPEDPEALAAALRRLADDPGLRATLGAEARKYAVTELSRGAVLARFERQVLRGLGAA
jgi:colanic acid biosynthesis glycosyl transferase WcaI